MKYFDSREDFMKCHGIKMTKFEMQNDNCIEFCDTNVFDNSNIRTPLEEAYTKALDITGVHFCKLQITYLFHPVVFRKSCIVPDPSLP